ncbi:MAG: SET domain-containing protein-lysine N-methyltransferase [Dokdonella sp.]
MTRRIIQRRSPIHGNGVFAGIDLPAGLELIEYRGRLLTHAEADEIYAEGTETGHTFLFTLNDTYVIDANVDGNSARWINHSCAPNCRALQVESETGDPREDKIVIETLRPLSAGEELTYDYGITLHERLTPRLKRIWACRCGAAECSGSMLRPKHKRKTAVS